MSYCKITLEQLRIGPEASPEAAVRASGPGRLGEEWLLRNLVTRLRHKLGDDSAEPRYIVTEPRVGYRMAAGEENPGVGTGVTAATNVRACVRTFQN